MRRLAAIVALPLSACGVDYVGIWDVTRWSVAVDGGPSDERDDAGFFEFRGGPYIEVQADYLLRYHFDRDAGAFEPLYRPQLLPLDYTPDADEQTWDLDGIHATYAVDPEGVSTLHLVAEQATWADGTPGTLRVELDLTR